MNLPDAPIAHEGFFAAHFLTARDQERSRDFCVRIIGGKLIKPENPCYIKLARDLGVRRALSGEFGLGAGHKQTQNSGILRATGSEQWRAVFSFGSQCPGTG